MKTFQQFLVRHRLVILNKVLTHAQYEHAISSVAKAFGKELASSFELYFTAVGGFYEFELTNWHQVSEEFGAYFSCG